MWLRKYRDFVHVYLDSQWLIMVVVGGFLLLAIIGCGKYAPSTLLGLTPPPTSSVRPVSLYDDQGNGSSAVSAPTGDLYASNSAERTIDDQTASSPEWAHIKNLFVDYDTALTVAKERDRPILLCFTAPQCPYSKVLLMRTFQDREIHRLADNFVCVLIRSDRQRSLCEEYGVDGYPTIQILSATGVRLQRLEGEEALTVDRLAMQMQVASDSHASRSETMKVSPNR